MKNRSSRRWLRPAVAVGAIGLTVGVVAAFTRAAPAASAAAARSARSRSAAAAATTSVAGGAGAGGGGGAAVGAVGHPAAAALGEVVVHAGLGPDADKEGDALARRHHAGVIERDADGVAEPFLAVLVLAVVDGTRLMRYP